MSKLFKWFSSRKRDKDVVQYDKCVYVCELNDLSLEFGSKSEMLAYIDRYAEKNTIYKLSMFKFECYNLIK